MKLQGFAFISEIVLGERKLATAVPGAPAAPKDPRFVPGQPFQVAKTGKFHSPVYGEIDITPKDLANMYRNFKQLTPLPPTQLPIDYDHLSDEPAKPEDGKAAGWVEDLQIRDGGNTLWCVPKWTKRAAQLIAEGAYRWCSPYFLTDYLDKTSGKKVGPTLKAIAITNRPFLEGMEEIPAPAIAASDKDVRQARWVAIPMRTKEKDAQGLRSSEKRATVEPSRKKQLHAAAVAAGAGHDQPQRRGARDMSAAKAAAVALDEGAIDELAEKTAPAPGPAAPAPPPGITCPHCGAPVKHVAAVAAGPIPDDTDAGAGDDGDVGELDETVGDADALEDTGATTDSPALDEGDAEMDETADGDALAEPSSDEDNDGDASTERVMDKTTSVKADELSDDASLDDEAALGDASQPTRPTPAAKSMSGVKMPARPPAAKPGAAPPPMPPAALRELRALREATARLEKQNAVNEKREQVRRGRALLQRGLREGKITPKMIGTPQAPTHTRRFAMRDPAGFAQWLQKEAPIVVEFRERGTSVGESQDTAAGTAANVDQLARALMAKDGDMDYATATRKVLAGNRALSDRYDREMSGQSPREVRPTSTNSAIR